MEVFDEVHEYPDVQRLIDDGLRPNVYYCYVPSTFVVAFLNHIEWRHGWVTRYYRDDEIDEDLAALYRDPHSPLADIGEEIRLTGQTRRYRWEVSLDPDVSDCCIGRVDISRCSSAEMHTASKLMTNRKWRCDLETRGLTGWLTF